MWETIKHDLISNLQNNLQKSVANWTLIYGQDHERLKENCLEYSNNIKEFSDQLLADSEREKGEIIKETEFLYKEFYQLCKELNMNCQDVDFADNDPLNNINSWLKEKVKQQKQVVSERLELYEDLLKKQHENCMILKETPFPRTTGTPSMNYLDDLTKHVEGLEMKKIEFDEQIKASSKSVMEILKRLELPPIHTIERFCMDPTSVSLTYNVDTLKDVEVHIEKLLVHEANMRNEADHLRESLSVLWARINESLETRERVLAQCKGYTKKEISMLKEELQRCEKIKQQNLKFYVENVKQELADWWSRCQFSEEEKNKFLPYKETHYSDEVLSLIELELERVKSFYSKYVRIFELLQQRKESWERLLHLEAASKDSRRLLSRDGNRGGALLREEQERKKVQKELPRTEELLNKKLDEFEEQEHREFTVYGESVRSLIKRQYDDFHAKKDQHHTKKVNGINIQPAAKKRKLPDAHQQQVSNKLCKVEGASDTFYSTFTVNSTASCGGLGALKKEDRLQLGIYFRHGPTGGESVFPEIFNRNLLKNVTCRKQHIN